jgi:hypothetical protein
VADIARTYRVTEEMARYRYNSAGIGRQVTGVRARPLAEPV